MPSVRARKRPRQESINFRRLYYVLRREAALRIAFPMSVNYPGHREARRSILDSPSRRLTRALTQILKLAPARRIWTPPPGTWDEKSTAAPAPAAEPSLAVPDQALEQWAYGRPFGEPRPATTEPPTT